jgi:TetR/AcrR family transcriptional regulator, transcriptional repressor for nem operon
MVGYQSTDFYYSAKVIVQVVQTVVMTPKETLRSQETPKEDTAQQILDVAQHLLQLRGYNAFSYADIAETVGIRKASIHYHFPSKHDLAVALVVRYRQTFSSLRSQIDQTTPKALDKLDRFANLYLEGLRNGCVCVCGMLAEDFTTVPLAVREEVKLFFSENEAWLTKVLVEGVESGDIRNQADLQIEAQLLLTSLQGAQLIARSYDDPARFQAIAQRLISGLRV